MSDSSLMDSNKDLETVSDAASLNPLIYDRRRTDIAESLGVRVTALDNEVKRLRQEQRSPKNQEPIVEDIEPWDSDVNLCDVLIEIEKLLVRYVLLPPGATVALTLWIAGTYVYNAFRIFPKLTLSSPEKRCGKTTLIEVMAALCNRALPASNISSAAIYRVIEAWFPTLLIDEADTFLKDNDELRGVINSGHTRASAYVIRLVGENHEAVKFSTWAPMVISGIKKPPDTIMDRSVLIPLRRKMPGELVTKIPLTLRKDCVSIRQKLARWALKGEPKLRLAAPTLPESGNDRALDNWTPLFAIAEFADSDWPERVITAFNKLAFEDDDKETIGVMILSDIRKIFDERNEESIFSSDLVDVLLEIKESPWSEWKRGRPLTQNGLARLLKLFGIKTKQKKMGDANRNGYEQAMFEDAFKRYLFDPHTALSPKPSNPTSTPLQRLDHEGCSQIQTSTNDESVEVRKSLHATSSKGCRGLEVETGLLRKRKASDVEIF